MWVERREIQSCMLGTTNNLPSSEIFSYPKSPWVDLSELASVLFLLILLSLPSLLTMLVTCDGY